MKITLPAAIAALSLGVSAAHAENDGNPHTSYSQVIPEIVLAPFPDVALAPFPGVASGASDARLPQTTKNWRGDWQLIPLY